MFSEEPEPKTRKAGFKHLGAVVASLSASHVLEIHRSYFEFRVQLIYPDELMATGALNPSCRSCVANRIERKLDRSPVVQKTHYIFPVGGCTRVGIPLPSKYISAFYPEWAPFGTTVVL